MSGFSPLEPTRHVNRDVRANIARELSAFYAELSGADGKPPPRFRLSEVLLAAAERRAVRGYEREVLQGAALMQSQHFDPDRPVIPLGALASRAMGTMPGAKGGYLSGAAVGEPVDALRPWSVTAQAGVQFLAGLRDPLVLPRVTTAPAASWLVEGVAGTESPPTLGAASLTPKELICLVKFSLQLLRQGAAVENFLRDMLLRAVGEALDIAVLAGAGGAQPLGLLQTTGIGTQAGAALAHSGILAMRRQVLAAGAIEQNLQWIGTPVVEEVLGARERATGGGRFLWDDEQVLGLPANASKNAPASTLICGDFSKAVVGFWGAGLQLEIDPTQDFATAGLVARALLFVDCAFPQPAAFCVATSVT